MTLTQYITQLLFCTALHVSTFVLWSFVTSAVQGFTEDFSDGERVLILAEQISLSRLMD